MYTLRSNLNPSRRNGYNLEIEQQKLNQKTLDSTASLKEIQLWLWAPKFVCYSTSNISGCNNISFCLCGFLQIFLRQPCIREHLLTCNGTIFHEWTTTTIENLTNTFNILREHLLQDSIFNSDELSYFKRGHLLCSKNIKLEEYLK